MRCIHPSQRCISSRQTTDNIFEIETTALDHVACAPQESGILLPPHIFVSITPSMYWRRQNCLNLICRFLRRIHYDSTTRVEFAGMTRGQFLMARSVRQAVRRVVSCLRWPSTLSFVGSKTRSFQGTLLAWTFHSRLSARMLTTSLWLLHLSGLHDRCGICLSNSGPNSWAPFEPSEMLLGAIWQ